MPEFADAENLLAARTPVPDDLTDYVITSSAGAIGQPGLSTREDIVAAVQRIVKQSPSNGLVLHFHGGLNSRASALESAAKLKSAYLEAGTYPLFFIWESGLGETLEVMLQGQVSAIFQENLARQLKRVICNWIGGWQNELMGMQLADAEPIVPDVDSIAVRVQGDLENDAQLQAAFDEVYAAAYGAPVGLVAALSTPTILPDNPALAEMFSADAPAMLGLGLWDKAKVAYFLATRIHNTLQRFRQSRDHGLEPTAIEEILSTVYLDKVGTDIWDQMKQATSNAFDPGDFAGTVLLEALSAIATKSIPTKITLVGHSAGAIYINNFLKAAETYLSAIQYDVVFLAPALRHSDFAENLAYYERCVRGFRMYSMLDDFESKDQLVSGLYIRSLLYFISGVLERNPLQDEPLIGMERYFIGEAVYPNSDFPDIASFKNFLNAQPNRSVWAVTKPDAAAGLGTCATHHGGYALEPTTLNSLTYVLKNGI